MNTTTYFPHSSRTAYRQPQPSQQHTCFLLTPRRAWACLSVKRRETSVPTWATRYYICLTVQAVAMTSAWTFSTQQRAAAFLGLVVLVFCISGAYAVHPMDLSLVTSRLQWVSPLRWTLEQLAMVEFAGGTTPMYDCPRGPVVL
ncbi:hypothetical protein MTO96_021068 [Rhipicephalus appendiculatus]